MVQFGSLPNFRYHWSENRGRSSARNAGIKLARGEWLLFLDSDDLLVETALEDLVGGARCDPTAGMIAGGIRVIDEDESVIAERPNNRDSKFQGLPKILREGNLSPGSYIIRRDVVDQIGGFDVSLEPCEDLDFCFRAASACRIHEIRSIVLSSRRHSGNTPGANLLEAGTRVARKYFDEVSRDRYLPALTRNRFRSDILVWLGYDYYRLGSPARAACCYTGALALDPLKIFGVRVFKLLLKCLVPPSVCSRP
jgi:glycosyltransferase involved in cell wall biosynthesis